MRKKLLRLYEILSKYKYIIIIVLFAVWILFLDQDNLFAISRRIKQIKNIKQKENFYKQEIVKDSVMLSELSSDNKVIEKFARENFFYHNKNEDVYKIVYQKK